MPIRKSTLFLDDFPGWRFDIGRAFALAKYSKHEDINVCEDLVASNYSALFNIPGP